MKRALKVTVFAVLLAGAYWFVDGALKMKYDDGIANLRYFYGRKKQDIDVLFTGSSHMLCSADTVMLWKEHGIPSYILGGSLQTLWNSYYYIKEGIKYQNPKIIVLEIYAACWDFDYPGWSWTAINTLGFTLSKDKIVSAFVSAEDTRGAMALLLGFPVYHGRYAGLSKDDFVDRYGGGRLYMNGYIKVDHTVPQIRPDMPDTSVQKALSPKKLEYLLKIIDLAKDRDVELVLILAPYIIPDDHAESFNTAARIAESRGLRFINYNMLYDELGLDFNTDFRDTGHLNIRGAEKFSRHIAGVLAGEYGIPDRRADPAYAGWNVWAEQCVK